MIKLFRIIFNLVFYLPSHLKHLSFLFRDSELRERFEIEKFSGSKEYYTEKARKVAKSCGENLHVNFKSSFGGEIYFKNNCNFNEMIVAGGGKVTFGNNFHLGVECMIITPNHNYDYGTAIPYDNTYIKKK